MHAPKGDALDTALRVRATERDFAIAVGALILGAVAMGASPIFVRLADVGPFASAFWRTFLALPFLWAWARFETGGAIEWNAFAQPSVLLAGLFFTGDLFFWHLSILGTTVANATFLATIAPIWVALGAGLFLRERIGPGPLAGLAMCMAGGVALLGSSYGFAPQRLTGDLYGVATSVFFGAYILAMRGARGHCGAATLALLSTAITAACLLIVALIFEPTLLPRSWSGVAWLVSLALISQVAGQGLLAVAIGSLPAMFSALVIFIEAIAAAAFGWLILGEALGAVQALGGVIILAGIWVARPRGEQRPTLATP
jgi:drug/metabolite transporter (DMT)-like permease